MNPLVSIIVPIYKVEKYLDRCVNSIRQQTYKNIEIILVDDGSPDNCPYMCDKISEEDNRIKVIHKKNGGLSDARNVGIDSAKGEFYCFVDSDDCIYKTMIEDLLNAIAKNGTKMALSSLKTVDELGNRVISKNESPIKDSNLTVEEILPKIYQEYGWYYIVAWNKMYHRSLFDNIRFPVGKIHEDEYVIAQIMYEAGTISCISREEYIYTYQRTGSIMSSRKVQSQLDWLEALYYRFLFCCEIDSLKFIADETRAVYFRELNNLFLNDDMLKMIDKAQIKQVKRQYSNMSGKSNTEKINWGLFLINPKLEKYIVDKVRKIRG